MKNNNLVIYTYQNKDGKSINKPQVISKIEKIIPYHQKTKSNFSFTNKTQLKNCLTVPNQPENENKRVKTANTVKTPQKFKNKSNKDQATKSKNENKPSQDPQKPSNTPATPQGDGNDTKGNESTPSTTKNGNANLFDPQKTERDHIDALLDAIEQGDFYVPIPGSIPLSIPDKNW